MRRADEMRVCVLAILAAVWVGWCVLPASAQFYENYYSFDVDCASKRCLTEYIAEIAPGAQPYLDLETIGTTSPPESLPVLAFHVTDFGVPDPDKRQVVIIGRLQGKEYTQNYVVEGLVNFLLSADPDAAALRTGAHFTIIPISNPYGANQFTSGNASGVDLQTDWDTSWHHPGEEAETRAIHTCIDEIAYRYGLDLVINLHDPFRSVSGFPGRSREESPVVDGDYGRRGPEYHPDPHFRPDQFNRLATFVKALVWQDGYQDQAEWDARVFDRSVLDDPENSGSCEQSLYTQHGVDICRAEYAFRVRNSGFPVTVQGLRGQGEALARAVHDYLFEVQHWVSSSGSDGNDGSLEYPWRTVAHAVSQVTGTADRPHIIHIGPGTYTGNIVMPDHVTLQGAGWDLTVLEASGGYVVEFNGVTGAAMDGCTVDGLTTAIACVKCTAASPRIANNRLMNSEYGVQCESGSGAAVYDNRITGNRFFGVSCTSGSNAQIINNLIHDNSFSGAAFYSVYVSQSDPVLRHNTIDDNDSPSQISYGVYTSFLSGPMMVGNNVTGNGEYGIHRAPAPTPSNPTLDHDNSWGQVVNFSNFGSIPGPNVISVNPMYVTGPGGDRYLSSGSFCVDAGPTPFPVPDYGSGDPTPFPLALYTTDVAEMRDDGALNIGFHHKISAPTPENTPAWTATMTPTATPTYIQSPTPEDTPTRQPTETPTVTPTPDPDTPVPTGTPLELAGSLGLDFEDPLNMDGWESTGLWHLVSEDSADPYYSANGYGNSQSWSRSYWYGQEASGDYDTGSSNSGFIRSPVIHLAGGTTNQLRFESWEQVEPDTGYDSRSVYVSNTGGASWYLWWQSATNDSQWREIILDLDYFSGQDVMVLFYFDTLTGTDNGYRGWYVDDIVIESSDPPPLPLVSGYGIWVLLAVVTVLLSTALPVMRGGG